MNEIQERLAKQMTDEAAYQRRIALFDMDGSITDYNGAMRRDLELLRAPSEPALPENLWDLERQAHIKHRMHFIKASPGWWRRLAPIEAGLKVVDAARTIGYDINVLTKGPNRHPVGWAEKLEWCRDHLCDSDDVHITMNKGLVYGTFLYDDFPEYMTAWLKFRPRGLGIMPATPANEGYEHPNVIRYDGTNFDQVYDALVSAYNRPFGTPLKMS